MPRISISSLNFTRVEPPDIVMHNRTSFNLNVAQVQEDADVKAFHLSPNGIATADTSAQLQLSFKGEQTTKLTLRTTRNRQNAITWQKVNVELSSVWAFQSVPTSGPIHLLFLPKWDLSSYLSSLPDNLPLSSLSLPGTHESVAQYGYPISTCQSLPCTLTYHLTHGVRFLDIRLSVKGEGSFSCLLAYHGLTDQRISFDLILNERYAFLHLHPSEMIIISVKQENAVARFKEMVLERYVYPQKSRWFLEPRIPTLGECRGKILLISRFGNSKEEPGGIHLPIWPNSSPNLFGYTLPSKQRVETQDWYDIKSLSAIETKMSAIQALLQSCGRGKELDEHFCFGLL